MQFGGTRQQLQEDCLAAALICQNQQRPRVGVAQIQKQGQPIRSNAKQQGVGWNRANLPENIRQTGEKSLTRSELLLFFLFYFLQSLC